MFDHEKPLNELSHSFSGLMLSDPKMNPDKIPESGADEARSPAIPAINQASFFLL